jgi:branched-subunit amino acid ABC-type transport system permease component
MTLFYQLLLNGIYVGSVYALLGLSFAAIFSTTKTWHFAQGAVYTLSAFTVLALAPHAGLVAAVGAAALLASGAGYACQRGLYEPLLARGASPLVIVMASLGLTIVIENVLALGFGPSGQSLLIDLGPPVIAAGLVIAPAQLLAPAVAAALVMVVVIGVLRSHYGRVVRALVSDEELLNLQGIATAPLKRYVFAAASAVLPIPATLLMLSGSGVSPFIGIPAVLTGAMALFLGGIDSLVGAAAAGLLIGIVENLSVMFLPTAWQTAITYSLLLMVIMVRPTGLFGRRLRQASL